jgi:hypothetical protein
VDTLAARALMSRRSFVRHFKAATGATPHAWLLTQRMNRAEELLEATDLPIEHVAEQVGYRNPAVFRDQFVLRRGVPPREYRRTFSRSTLLCDGQPTGGEAGFGWGGPGSSVKPAGIGAWRSARFDEVGMSQVKVVSSVPPLWSVVMAWIGR